MLESLKAFFRRTLFKTYRLLKHPRRLKRSPLMRWFALHFLDKRVWRPTQHTLSGGMAIGTFITLQLLPIQMPSAAILAAVLRVNIPIALVMCWLSNPATAVILIPLEYAVGRWTLSFITQVPSTPFPTALPSGIVETWMALKEHAPVMLFGGVVLGALLAPISYMMTYVCWGYSERWSQLRKSPRLPLAEE
jgi:uncharacterized protein